MKTFPVHLDKQSIVNLGSFYTAQDFVEIVWDFIKKLVDEHTFIFDPACGYGQFLLKKTIGKKLGNDIDRLAIKKAREHIKDCLFFCKNALENPTREKYNIPKDAKLIIIGNPPYNDLTSQAKKRKKQLNFKIDEKLKSRDIGISFLRMFTYLKPQYVCILHPLSYLIKKANFNLLREFKENYILKKSLIISSKVFSLTSKTSPFPIIIALYEYDKKGMNFDYIENFKFTTIEGKTFCLKDFEYIGNFIDKYPKKKVKISGEDILFYTLRDINALRRNKTFIDKPISNAVKINLNKLEYYIYVDVFKDFLDFVPYYLGNLDIIINSEEFNKYKKFFISYALKKRDFLKKFFPNARVYEYKEDNKNIILYLKKLLGEHFNENSRDRL